MADTDHQQPPDTLPDTRLQTDSSPAAPAGVGADLCASVGLTVLFHLLLVIAAIRGWTAYGLGLFLLVPLSLGVMSAMLYGWRRERTWGQAILAMSLSLLLLGGGLIACAQDGAVCVLMALPLAYLLAFLGCTVGHQIQRERHRRLGRKTIIFGLLTLVPFLLGVEHAFPPPDPLLQVSSAIEVEAPPEVVWRHVISFATLPPPTEAIFKAGVAYPIRAEIRGRGVGAVRHCVFSTGPFVEPITVWDAPRLLRFRVTANPAPLREWSPYGEIHPPHLDGFLQSSQGQFELTPLPGGRTRLAGTTWYRHHLHPAAYWQLWSDQIIHTIHLRVLRHVKALAEADGQSPVP